MRRRLPLALSAVLLLAQIGRLPALIDVGSRTPPSGASLHYPLAHILFAPVSLLADWLNGGSRAELLGFLGWAIAGYAAFRLIARASATSAWRECVYALTMLVGLVAFVGWVVFVPRSIPRLAVSEPDRVVFDVHSHTAASRDGRRGFGVPANARWHERAGFHAAFVTDHNVKGDANQWRGARGRTALRLLEGEELSLRGLHVIVLGNTGRINNEPWNDDWDSTLKLLTELRGTVGRGDSGTGLLRPPVPPSPGPLYLIASLPEYWKHHWGPDIGRMVEAGIEGFEVWTTSPRAMEVPDLVRREVVARARLERLAVFGATDMHGIGHTATVWNVATVRGWRDLGDSALTWALIGAFRRNGAGANDVVAMRRWLPQGRAGLLVAVPVGLLTALRTASLAHAASLLLWIWAMPLVHLVRNARR